MDDLSPASVEDIQYLRDYTEDEPFLEKPPQQQRVSARGSIAWTPETLSNALSYEPSRGLYFPEQKEDSISVKWKVILIILGASLMAILAGTTNAFSTYGDKIQDDLSLDDYFISVSSSLGVLGLNFVVPAGLLLDRYGPVKVGVVSTIITSICFLLSSFCDEGTAWLLLILFICIGFGSGGIFMSALGTSISLDPSGGGPGVSIVSACMSLSVAFVVLLVQIFQSITGCTQVHCWRDYFELFGFSLLVFALPGSLLLLFFKKSDFPHLIGVSSNPRQRISFWESLAAFKDISFLTYMISFFVAIGSSVVVLLDASNIWKDYDSSDERKHWPQWIILGYSLSNAFCNVLCGLLSDYLRSRRVMDQTTLAAVVQLLFGAVFLGLGLLSTMPHDYPYLYAAFMVCPGLGFGCYLVLYPIIIADKYGALNFGKYFAFLQCASSAASLAIPQIGLAIRHRFGDCTSLFYAMAVALVAAGFLLYGVPLLMRQKDRKRQLREYQILANTIN